MDAKFLPATEHTWLPLLAGYFTFWVILSLVWGLCATVVATLLPIWESREALINMCRHFAGKGSKTPSTPPPPVDDLKPAGDFKSAAGDVQMGTPPVKDSPASAFRV